MLAINSLAWIDCCVDSKAIKLWEFWQGVINEKSDIGNIIVGVNPFWMGFWRRRLAVRMLVIPSHRLKVHEVYLRKGSCHWGLWRIWGLLMDYKWWGRVWAVKIAKTSRNWAREDKLNPPADRLSSRIQAGLRRYWSDKSYNNQERGCPNHFHFYNAFNLFFWNITSIIICQKLLNW